MKLNIANQHFSCQKCGRCCRSFQVLLRPSEVYRLGQLKWKDEPPQDFLGQLGKYGCFRRSGDGACVLLDARQRCRLQQEFGYGAKALSCRGYPLNFAPTFPGEMSVLARFDCPAVLADAGDPLRCSSKELLTMSEEIGVHSSFSASQLEGLERPAVELITSTLIKILKEGEGNIGQKMGMFQAFCCRCRQLGQNFLNDIPTLREVLPSMLEKLGEEAEDWPKMPLGWYSQGLFRLLLWGYARHDGEIFQPTFALRMRRLWNNITAFFGQSKLQNAGREHPAAKIAAGSLFSRPLSVEELTTEVWHNYLRFLQVRLETLQFFSHAHYGVKFYAGLQALANTFPLALAFAKIKAQQNKIGAADVDYGVASVDYSHGRTANLNAKSYRFLEKFFAEQRFFPLIFSLAGPIWQKNRMKS